MLVAAQQRSMASIVRRTDWSAVQRVSRRRVRTTTHADRKGIKIGGYTQTGGQGPLSTIPLAGFVLNSFTHSNTSQPQPAAPDFGRNNNFALDQVSLFFAGRITDFAGAFVQGTYDGVGHAFFLDNTDLRIRTMWRTRKRCARR